MAAAIGLLELKSIPVGLETADAALKGADIKLLVASPSCPGKYVIVMTGDVGAVKSAMEIGEKQAGRHLIAQYLISSIHPMVPSAIAGTAETENIQTLGMVETISALTAIHAGDIAAKAASVHLLEIRLARGLGGKGYVLMTGDVSAVNAAVRAVETELEESGEIISTCVISNPHPDLIAHI